MKVQKQVKNEKGITLIALVITIIVLLILAGVTINLTLGNNGIFKTAEQAAKNYTNAQEKELAELGEFNNKVNDIVGGIEEDKGVDGRWSEKNKVNMPNLKNTGLEPVTINTDGSYNSPDIEKDDWYSYDGTENHWANAKTKDESMWVWIPRYAYKITTATKTIDVVFLKDCTNFDENGKDVTQATYVDAKGATGAYIVHPSFQNGTANNFANGEWDKEIPGYWVAKFEAGYVGEAGKPDTAINSNVTLSTIYSYYVSGTTGANGNITSNYYGARKVGDSIKYPVFKANRPAMNYISIADAYDLCMDLKNGTAVYGLSNIDSHMMKNSEWGAVVYLTQSQYGRNGTEVTINNVSVNNQNTIYAVTGYAGATVSAKEDTTRNLATLTTQGQVGSWTTIQGQNASSTKNIYGIYDLSGGLWEFTAGYIKAGTYDTYAGIGLKENNGESTKYKSKYDGTSVTNTANYNLATNKARKGEAIWETSTAGSGSTSWGADYSNFYYAEWPFSARGACWGQYSYAGTFAFHGIFGYCGHYLGFRAVLVPNR